MCSSWRYQAFFFFLKKILDTSVDFNRVQVKSADMVRCSY